MTAHIARSAWLAAMLGMAAQAVPAALNDYDISAGYVQRLPSLAYVWNSTNATVEGWPAPGSNVTWRAHVKNWHTAAFENVAYRWTLDGALLASGTVTLAAATNTPVDVEWPWSFARHELVFAIDAGNAIAEYSERNNRILTYTDAIAAGLWVEHDLYQYFHTHQYRLNDGANGWEDWAQRQVRRWNEMYANARYGDDTPSGVLDRVRLDQINIVSNGALPLSGCGYAGNFPDRTNRTVDLMWGFETNMLSGSFYANHTSAANDNPFFYEGSLIHELGHARYLIDTYGFNVHDTNPGGSEPRSNILVSVDGRIIVGTPYMPLNAPWWDSVYFPTTFGDPGYGLMSSPYTLIDQYSAMALNLIAGRRAVSGNYNSPGNIGAFKNDLPQENLLTLRDSFGSVLAGATVLVYRATYKSGDWYGKKFDDIADQTNIADMAGVVALGRSPFAGNGVIQHTYGIANGVLIGRVEHAGRTGFFFLDVMNFNMEYWRGHTATGFHQVVVAMHSGAFGIAGVAPATGHTTARDKIATITVTISGPTNAQSVRINGVSATYNYGAWRRTDVALVLGTNVFTVIATAPWGAAETQTVQYIRRDSVPPVAGVDAVVVPYPESTLIAGTAALIRWLPVRFYDNSELSVAISQISIIEAGTGSVVTNLPGSTSNNGSRTWTPGANVPLNAPLTVRFILADAAGNVTTQAYSDDVFTVVPEPGLAGVCAAMALAWRGRGVGFCGIRPPGWLWSAGA